MYVRAAGLYLASRRRVGGHGVIGTETPVGLLGCRNVCARMQMTAALSNAFVRTMLTPVKKKKRKDVVYLLFDLTLSVSTEYLRFIKCSVF